MMMAEVILRSAQPFGNPLTHKYARDKQLD